MFISEALNLLTVNHCSSGGISMQVVVQHYAHIVRFLDICIQEPGKFICFHRRFSIVGEVISQRLHFCFHGRNETHEG